MFSFLSFESTQKDKMTYSKKFIRVEINYGAYHSLKIFKDGLLCKSVNSDLSMVFDYYPLKDLDHEKFLKIQDYLYGNDFFNMDSVYENPLIKYSSYRIDFLFLTDSKIKRIEWLSGGNMYLNSLLVLVNDLIPENKRNLYSINSMFYSKDEKK